MSKLDKFTFLMPIFNLKNERYENFKYVLSKIKEVTDNILVVEQVKNNRPTKSKKYTESLGINYLPVLVDDDSIHKSKLINIGTDNIQTEFVWVNDSDCYLKFQKVIDQLDFRYNFIQPYSVGKYISKEETEKIFNGKSVQIEFDYKRLSQAGQHIIPGTLYYVAMYGALSFIYRKNTFEQIGAMNEEYTGWGFEDNSLCMRMFISKSTFDVIDQPGIHLFHPRGDYKEKLQCERSLSNVKVYEREFEGICIDLHRRLRDYYKSLFSEKLLILGIERSGTNLLIDAICRLINLTYYSEPLGPYGLYERKYINYEDFNLDSYISFFTSKPSACIKHIDSIEASPPANFNISREKYAQRVCEDLINSSSKTIITTRLNFMDWMTSFALASRENNWVNKKYQSSFKLKEEEFYAYYKKWYDYHYTRLPRYINKLKDNNKKYMIIDYDNLCQSTGDLSNIDLEITYKDILSNSNIFKQKTKNNSEYIINYNEVLNWFNSAKKSL